LFFLSFPYASIFLDFSGFHRVSLLLVSFINRLML
jgi:hypothetical protein